MNGFGQQIKMARAALGLTLDDLAARSEVGRQTIVNMEAGRTGRRASVAAIRRALEDAGVRFIDADIHGGPGVRLRGKAEAVPRYETENIALQALGKGAEQYLAERPELGVDLGVLVGSAVIVAGSSIAAAEQLYLEQSAFFDRVLRDD